MLKTDMDRYAEPDVSLIIRGLLSGYVRYPVLFMMRMKLGMSKMKKDLPPKLPQDIAQLAAMIASLYTLLKPRVGTEQALAMVEAVVIPVGLAKQMALFRFVEDPSHTFENLVRCQQRAKEEGLMRLNRMEVLETSDARYRFKVHNCVFKAAFTRLGVPELTGVLCKVDNALYNIYSPDRIVFHRDGAGNRIADGAKSCAFVCENRAFEPEEHRS